MSRNNSQRPVVCVVVGTRPEVVKMAPVYMALRQSEKLQPLLLSTGQHRQMLDQTLAVFGIKPDFDLEVMQPSQTLPELTSRTISRVAAFFKEHRPQAVLVQGDTTTVFSSAIAAFYEGVRIGHVEAGLRTGNMYSPWPEEMNRRLIAPLCEWNFTPTPLSAQNLIKEQVPEQKCFVTGNTVVDALLWMREALGRRKWNSRDLIQRLELPAEFAERYFAEGGDPLILVTGHRRESFGAGFERFCEALLNIVERDSQVGILYPVHLNPAVREPVMRLLGQHPRIALTNPASYEDFVWLMDRCRFIITDSGGVQEEAPSLGKPVLVTRDTTERPEGVEAGTCTLVGTDPEAIVRESMLLLKDTNEYRRRSQLANPYGDGQAADRIRQILEERL